MERVLEQMMQLGVIDADGAGRAHDLMVTQSKPLDEAVIASGAATEDAALKFFSEHFGVPMADLTNYAPTKEFLRKFPVRILLRHRLIPIGIENGAVSVAAPRFFESTGLDELRLATGMDTKLTLAPSSEIDRCARRYLGVGADTLESMASEDSAAGIEVLSDEPEDDVDLSADGAGEASIIKFVNQVLAEGIQLRSTDVHFEPFERELRVRYRIDGVLQEANIPATVKQYQASIISRLKILAHLNIAEKRLPQDGRIKLKIGGNEVDVRASIIPMLHGEGVVLRLLHRGSALLGLEQLGMCEDDIQLIQKVLDLPHGIFLVTGPTGSGKTTTLYAALTRINTPDLKIITVEDPVEYHLNGINQIQVNMKAGLTFASGLRSILRHDPDVILIGEIRDQETADIAVQASLTGHLVFSTLHTNDAPGALTRLVDMGVEPYLVASSLEGVLAQRLVRLICKHCKDGHALTPKETMRLERSKVVPKLLYRGKGCRECQGTGYRGRTVICEQMAITEELKQAILARTSTGEIRKIAMKQGMKSLNEDGLRLISEGKTTLEEVLRATKDDA
ncbi:MAG TPA: GspE/PulE family protein [Planctomycetota bacterium]|nr:GspE/PulE family protein [Planctomycetota bacterium]